MKGANFVLISAKTDVGKVRDENQDAYAVGHLPDGVFAVVCDGMGGAAGGQIASSTAAEVFSSAFPASYESASSERSLKSMLTVLADKANAAVYDLSLRNPDLKGMGTTIVAAVLEPARISVVHAGDSRAYLLRDGEITQLTRDHSMVQMLVDNGYISEEQAEHHMYKNIITRALGTEATVQVDFAEFPAQERDAILLCSDGLTNYVSISEIKQILSQEDLDNAVSSLVDTANKNGGGDNITAVVLKNC